MLLQSKYKRYLSCVYPRIKLKLISFCYKVAENIFLVMFEQKQLFLRYLKNLNKHKKSTTSTQQIKIRGQLIFLSCTTTTLSTVNKNITVSFLISLVILRKRSEVSHGGDKGLDKNIAHLTL